MFLDRHKGKRLKIVFAHLTGAGAVVDSELVDYMEMKGDLKEPQSFQHWMKDEMLINSTT